jgi:hypothetical protein
MTEEIELSGPSRDLPSTDDEHYQLYKDVREAISSLPIYFRTETHISGIMATDLHTLNTVLGATIEEQVVRTLNLIRNTLIIQSLGAKVRLLTLEIIPNVRR